MEQQLSSISTGSLDISSEQIVLGLEAILFLIYINSSRICPESNSSLVSYAGAAISLAGWYLSIKNKSILLWLLFEIPAGVTVFLNVVEDFMGNLYPCSYLLIPQFVLGLVPFLIVYAIISMVDSFGTGKVASEELEEAESLLEVVRGVEELVKVAMSDSNVLEKLLAALCDKLLS